MLTRQLRRFSNILFHISRGTIREYIRKGYRDYRDKKRRLRWYLLFKDNDRSYVMKRIASGTYLRCYRDSWLSRLIYWGVFENDERKFVIKFLRKGDVFLDIGSHYGLFALLASRIVGPSGHVYAFEPSQDTYQRLLDHIADNKITNITAYRMAISDKKGKADIYNMLDGKEAFNSLTAPTGGGSFSAEQVETIPLDTFVEENSLQGKVTLIKIDVEGWEAKILEGGNDLFASKDAPALMLEFNEKLANAAGSSCDALYHKLRQLGYELFLYEQKTNMFTRLEQSRTFAYQNLIAAKQPQELARRVGRSTVIES